MATSAPWDHNKCESCGKTFVEPKRLYKHMFDVHKYSKAHIEDYKQRRRKKKVQSTSISKEKPIYSCEMCQQPYLSKLGLTQHMTRSHNVPKRETVPGAFDQVACPINICAKKFQTYFDLAIHCDVEHKDLVLDPGVFRVHRMKFNDYDKFQDWRSEQEQLTETKFYCRSTETKCLYGRKTWFLKCLHTQKTSKTVDFYHYHCPAFIRVVERHSGLVEAVACFGHLGHPHYTQNTEIIQYMKRDPRMPEYAPDQVFLQPKQTTEIAGPEDDQIDPVAEYNTERYTSEKDEEEEYIDLEEDFLQDGTVCSS